MNTISNKKISTKLITPLIIIIIIIVGYFVYKSLFSTKDIVLDNKSNVYVSKTKLGKYIDIINKENLIFNTNVNSNSILEIKDFSVNINPSAGIGRKNPFLP